MVMKVKMDITKVKQALDQYFNSLKTNPAVDCLVWHNADDFEAEIRFLGEIYICIPRMIEQAKEFGHSEKRELSFLCVHGLLHLLGYDHMEKEDEKVMFALQELILNEANITR